MLSLRMILICVYGSERKSMTEKGRKERPLGRGALEHSYEGGVSSLESNGLGVKSG